MSDRDEYTSVIHLISMMTIQNTESEIEKKTIYDILNAKSQFGQLIDFL